MLRTRLALATFGLVLGLVVVLLVSALGGDGRKRPEYLIDESSEARTYFRSDPDLGYAPAPGARVRSMREIDGDLIYDVRYTIDEHGLRATPGSGDDGPAVVLFGGSFMFGEGVEDDQSLPASLARWLNDDTRILNAGFHGYGPHHMLRSLETERLDPLVSDGVEHVIYLGIDGHAKRAAGRTTWDQAGPQYETRDGVVSFVGPFRSAPAATVVKILNRFGPTRDLLRWWLEADEAGEEADRRLYVDVVARAADVAREKWGAGFTVLYWDHKDEPFVDLLRERGLDVVPVSDALEGRSWRRFVLGVDRHPNRFGHQTMARAVARHLRRARRTTARSALSSGGPPVLDGADGGGAGGGRE